MPPNRRREACPGRTDSLSDAGLGHTIRTAHCAGEPLFYCSICGAWMTRRPVGLAGVCKKQPSLHGRRVLHRITKRGVHPVTFETLDGSVWKPIGRVEPGPNTRSRSSTIIQRHSQRAKKRHWTSQACFAAQAPPDGGEGEPLPLEGSDGAEDVCAIDIDGNEIGVASAPYRSGSADRAQLARAGATSASSRLEAVRERIRTKQAAANPAVSAIGRSGADTLVGGNH